MNPYFINEPAVISFSGGRTSAYMLWKIIEAHDGELPSDVKVIFSNTGKEMPQTLDFVQACSDNWGVDIVWLELAEMSRAENEKNFKKSYKVVDYESASRNGEPFDILLDAMPAIPNAVGRYCTAEMKIRPMTQYIIDAGYETPVLTMVGIRGDEVRRAKKIQGTVSNGQEKHCPLYLSAVTAADVGHFWEQQNFDLELPNNNGVTDWGNCDLCFLKGKSKRAAIIRERPDLVDWWAAAEKRKGQQFRPDEPSYQQMKIIATTQGQLFDFDDESIPCFCGD
jgi:3'-phosphoadenosine 5'-phosphosulfate sulfotransferase (PAPS reductase)/FAD synthetase